jgi:hypothetical protein
MQHTNTVPSFIITSLLNVSVVNWLDMWWITRYKLQHTHQFLSFPGTQLQTDQVHIHLHLSVRKLVKKVKFTLEQAMKAQMGVALLFCLTSNYTMGGGGGYMGIWI